MRKTVGGGYIRDTAILVFLVPLPLQILSDLVEMAT